MKMMPRKKNKKNQGFTLIELLIVVSLIIIVVGVTGDIVVSLVRSYSKTQINNEVEQNLNYIITKIEKDLRNATTVTTANSSELTFTRRNATGTGYEGITYEIVQANERGLGGNGGDWVLIRSVDTDGNGTLDVTDIPVTNYFRPHGVGIDTATSGFSLSGSNPTVVAISFTVKHLGSGVATQFTSSASSDSTVVVRGTY